jgi:hypothetical protein
MKRGKLGCHWDDKCEASNRPQPAAEANIAATILSIHVLVLRSLLRQYFYFSHEAC